MTSTNTHLRKISITTGISLLIMALLAGFSIGFVQDKVYILADYNVTYQNIQNNMVLYQLGNISMIGIFLLDLLLSYTFYQYLKIASKKIALITGLLRFIYSLILGISIIKLYQYDLDQFNTIWILGLIIFGFHLLTAGYGAMKISAVPKVISILLIIAGISYTLVSTLFAFFPALDSVTTIIETVLMLPMTIGELGFGVWLLVKGGKTKIS